MWLLLVTLAAGIGSGYWATGRHERSRVLTAGLLVGAAIMIFAAMAGFLFGIQPLGLADVSTKSLLTTSFMLGVSFTVGVWFVTTRFDRERRPRPGRGPSD